MLSRKSAIIDVLIVIVGLFSSGALAEFFLWPNLDQESDTRVMVAAHRGANQMAPENTLAAFRIAISQEVDFIEFDVRTTSDGQLIIMHDADVSRTTNGEGKVKELTSTDIKSLSAGAWFDASFAHERVPGLRELFEALIVHYDSGGYRLGLYVDCKDTEPQSLLDCINEYGLLNDCIFYGHDDFLVELKKRNAGIKIMPSLRKASDLQEKVQRLSPYAFDVPWSVLTEDLVRQIRESGIKVFTDAPFHRIKEQEYHRIIGMGVDLIQTDHIEALQQAIESFYER